MSQSVRVNSVQSLLELKLALRRFSGEILEILQSTEQEIVRTERMLNDQILRYRYEEERCQEEVLNAKRDLKFCRDEDDHSCSFEEESLAKAKWHLSHAQMELQDSKKKLGALENVSGNYRKQARRLKRLMDEDLQKGDIFLNSAITELNEYLGVHNLLLTTIGSGGGVISQVDSKELSFSEKNRIIENLPGPEGMPYSENMKKYLIGLCHMDNDDFQVITKYLKSKEHKPAIFNDQAMADNVFKRDFPSHAKKEGSWNSDWLGVTLYFTDTHSSVHGIPEQAHRIIIANYREDVLIHELAHQLHYLAWSETGKGGENKRTMVKELYANSKVGRVRPVSKYITDEGEYFAYSVEWFFQRPMDLKSRDPNIFQFLNTHIFKGMYK